MTNRILVVDDEEMVCEVLKQFLIARGFEVECVFTGPAALAKVEAEPPDLVLLDIRMPGMSGEQVLAKIKATHPGIAVIMVTALRDVEVSMRCMQLGAIECLSKPLDLENLERCIRSSLR